MSLLSFYLTKVRPIAQRDLIECRPDLGLQRGILGSRFESGAGHQGRGAFRGMRRGRSGKAVMSRGIPTKQSRNLQGSKWSRLCVRFGRRAASADCNLSDSNYIVVVPRQFGQILCGPA